MRIYHSLFYSGSVGVCSVIHDIIHLDWPGETFLVEDLNNTRAEDDLLSVFALK